MEKNILNIDPFLILACSLIRFRLQTMLLYLVTVCIKWWPEECLCKFEALVRTSVWDLYALEIYFHSYITKFLKNYFFFFLSRMQF